MRDAAGLIVAPAEATLGRRPETFQLAGLDDLLVLVSVVVATLGRVVAVRLFGLRLRGSRSAPGTCSGGSRPVESRTTPSGSPSASW